MDIVAETTTDELTRADEAFAGNRLLSTFSREARALIEPYGEMVDLEPGEIVLQRGDQVRASLFPVGPTMISMTVELAAAGRRRSPRSEARARWAGSSAAATRRPSPARRCWCPEPHSGSRWARWKRRRAARTSSAICSAASRISCSRRSCNRSSATRFIRSPNGPRAGCCTPRTGQGTGSNSLRKPSRPARRAAHHRQRRRQGAFLRGPDRDRAGRDPVVDRAGLERRSCECYERLEEYFGAVIGQRRHRPDLGRRAASEASRRRGTARRRRSSPGTSPLRSSVTVPSLSGRP